ncbi:MAG TPA: RsmG family class I SAM-dependent methyltransferase [Pyrinomonadaceae bacterium]|nr:RsmG family class I SAM-dependent methyltransferase [Pyrinomonadaceae bacterium]
MNSRDELIKALESNELTFGLDLSTEQIERLADYCDLVQKHNPLLHLVGPCMPEEFAVRHILESLTLLEHLPTNSKFVDVGAGAGLPSIPCLIVRDDLRATLIESKGKKAGFLQTAIAKCKLYGRAEVINQQFFEAKKPDVSFVTCRALDKFTEKLPQLLKWSGDCILLFFGGPALRSAMRKHVLVRHERLMPLSEQRYLFVAENRIKKNK